MRQHRKPADEVKHLEPWVKRGFTAAKIHPVLVIFALFLGEHSYGLVGALLAVPILSAIQVVFMYLFRKKWKDAPRSGPIPSLKPPAVELPPTKT